MVIVIDIFRKQQDKEKENDWTYVQTHEQAKHIREGKIWAENKMKWAMELLENLELKHLGRIKHQAEKSLCLDEIGVLQNRAGSQCGQKGRAREKVGRQGCSIDKDQFRLGWYTMLPV